MVEWYYGIEFIGFGVVVSFMVLCLVYWWCGLIMLAVFWVNVSGVVFIIVLFMGWFVRKLMMLWVMVGLFIYILLLCVVLCISSEWWLDSLGCRVLVLVSGVCLLSVLLISRIGMLLCSGVWNFLFRLIRFSLLFSDGNGMFMVLLNRFWCVCVLVSVWCCGFCLDVMFIVSDIVLDVLYWLCSSSIRLVSGL